MRLHLRQSPVPLRNFPEIILNLLNRRLYIEDPFLHIFQRPVHLLHHFCRLYILGIGPQIRKILLFHQALAILIAAAECFPISAVSKDSL